MRELTYCQCVICVCAARVSSRSPAPRCQYEAVYFGLKLQTICEAPQSFTLTHIWEQSAAVAHADSPPPHAHTKSAYTSIHRDGISTLPSHHPPPPQKKVPASALCDCFHDGLVASRDPLLQIRSECELVSPAERAGFPPQLGYINTPSSLPFPFFLSSSSSSPPPTTSSTYTAPLVFVCCSQSDPLGVCCVRRALPARLVHVHVHCLYT